jgi:hypothetical protein
LLWAGFELATLGDAQSTATASKTFRTVGTSAMPKAPEVVSLNPPNRARDVSPALKELRVTFNVRMGGGMSWNGGGPNFPPSPEGKKAYWTKDGKTCVLPVELKPGSQYTLGLNTRGLNDRPFEGFQSAKEAPLDPVIYTFRTSNKP